jgi:tetratricopeptide (TPR) repeat protein
VLGERETGTEHLGQAVAAYRLALEERTRQRDPLGWAGAQTGLGNALERLGERDPGTPYLEQAVAAYRQALEEETRERNPIEWAKTQYNLGLALAALGTRRGDNARLDEALTCFRQASPVLRAGGMAEAATAADRMADRLSRERGASEEH